MTRKRRSTPSGSQARGTITRDLAALLAVILGVATMLMLAVMTRLEKGGTYFSVSKVSSGLQKQQIRNPVANVALHAVACLLFAVYTLPVVLIVLYSFADGAAIQTGQLSPGSLTQDNYLRVLTQPSVPRPFILSIVYSALAAVIAVGGLLFLARLLQKYRNWVTGVFEYLLHIPWILPSARPGPAARKARHRSRRKPRATKPRLCPDPERAWIRTLPRATGQVQKSSALAVSSKNSRPSAIFPSRTTNATTVVRSMVLPLPSAWVCWMATV